MSNSPEKPKPDKTVYLMFFSAITPDSTQQLLDVIGNDLPNETTTLYLVLCTEGGSVSHGVALYNLLRGLPYKIIVHNIANIDSIGNVILMAGDERYATANATFLLHKVSSSQKAADKIATNDLLEKISSMELDAERINHILLSHTQLTQDDLDGLYTKGQSKNAHYALEKGLVHDIRDITVPATAFIKVIKSS